MSQDLGQIQLQVAVSMTRFMSYVGDKSMGALAVSAGQALGSSTRQRSNTTWRGWAQDGIPSGLHPIRTASTFKQLRWLFASLNPGPHGNRKPWQ